MNQPVERIDRAGLRSRLIVALAAVVIASVTAVGLAAIAAFDRAIEPELNNRTQLIGSIVRAEIQRALELNIPISALGGLESYLATTLAKFAEVERITVATATGEVVAAAERTAAPSLVDGSPIEGLVSVRAATFALPILHGNRLVAEIRVETSPMFVQTQLRGVFLDVMVLALIATLVAVELALAVTISSVGKPLDRVLRLLEDQRNGNFLHRIRPGGLSGLGRTAARLNDHAEDLAERVGRLPQALRSRIDAAVAVGRPDRLRLSDFNDVRLALFLFSVATEIAAAFMPLYARSASRPEWIGPEIAAVAPLVIYLAAIAGLSPFGSALVNRFGARRMFLAAVPMTALSLVAMGLSDSLTAITLWRGVMAVFYAVATVACQGYIIRAVGGQASARAFTAFIAVLYGGVFTGSALGGLIAGRFGFEAAFVIGAAIAVLSGALGAASMRGRAGDAGRPASPAAQPQAQTPRRLDSRFAALVLGIAVPMNIATAVFVWYLTPLMLAAAGSGPAEIGRVVMLYPLAVVLVAPSAARLADGRLGAVVPLVIGAAGAAAAMLSLALWDGFWAVATAMAGLGLGHSFIRATLYPRALRLAGGPGRGVDALRMLERIGAMLGLGASAFLLDDIGAAASIWLLGLVVLAGGGAYAVAEAAHAARRH